MTTALLEADHGNWHAHAQISEFAAAAERDAMHVLFPERARLVDECTKRGTLHHLNPLLIPHIEGDVMAGLGFDPTAMREYEGNLLVNAGINRLGALLIASGGLQAYDATHTAVGVGDTATAAAATDTDLTATVNAANRYVQVADGSYPTFATQVLTVQSTFATGNGNFHWQEWGIAGNTSSAAAALTAPMLNHKIVDLGTKTSASAWVFRVTITIS